VIGLDNCSSMATGGRHNCAVRDERLYCWGDNGDGELGNGTLMESFSPVLVTF
jgi:serine/threonine-protein kinase